MYITLKKPSHYWKPPWSRSRSINNRLFYPYPVIHHPAGLVARACSSMTSSSARSSLVLWWYDRSSKMMYFVWSPSISANCVSDDFLLFLPLPVAVYEPNVAMWLRSPVRPSLPVPAVTRGLLLPRMEAPKSCLTRGNNVGMQAPMRTQLASMLWRRVLVVYGS